MNLGSVASFCLQKTNHATELTAGGNGDYRVHVYSFATCAQLNKVDYALVFSEITFILVTAGTVTVTISLFFLASQRLVLELPPHFNTFISLENFMDGNFLGKLLEKSEGN